MRLGALVANLKNNGVDRDILSDKMQVLAHQIVEALLVYRVEKSQTMSLCVAPFTSCNRRACTYPRFRKSLSDEVAPCPLNKFRAVVDV